MLPLFNRVMTWLADMAIRPWAGESPWPSLIASSALTALLLVGLFRWVSNPSAIRRARNRFLARTLELHLFRHDLRVSLTAVGRIFTANVLYVSRFAFPMLISSAPLLLIYVQLAGWFEHRPLRPGETAVVEVELPPAFPVLQTPVTLQTSEEVKVDSPGVRSAASNTVSWRIRSNSSGEGWLDVQCGDQTLRKSVTATSNMARVSTQRVGPAFASQLLSPGEPPLPAAGPISRIEIVYPQREFWAGTSRIPWSVAALGFIMAFGLAFGRLFGVPLA